MSSTIPFKAPDVLAATVFPLIDHGSHYICLLRLVHESNDEHGPNRNKTGYPERNVPVGILIVIMSFPATLST